MTEIAYFSARRLASMIRRGKIGCLELLDHYLDRVDRHNPALNAIIVTDIPAARDRARAADRALAKGEVWGPFHGLPMTVKESFDIAGLPTTWGSPAHERNIATSDALAVTRWRDAGAVIFGKTNVPIWLADAQSVNEIYGRTNNPWNTDLSPGGSSGGASAALAAGLTGIEMGTDIASSLRNPAHMCGVYSLKPTYGICPPHGMALDGTLTPLDISVIGPLARSAADLEPALRVMAGPDAIDAAGVRLVLPAPAKRVLADFKVAVILDHSTAPVAREVGDRIAALADFLGHEGAEIVEGARPDIDMDEAQRTFDIMLRAATSAVLSDEEFRAGLAHLDVGDPDADDKRARGLKGVTLTHREWLGFDEVRTRMRWRWHDFFQDYDLLLCPPFCTAAFAHDERPTYAREYLVGNKAYPFMNQTFWSGYTGLPGLPAATAPIGFTDEGLPVGVQIVGPHYGDRTCIRFAQLLERAYQGFVAPPGYA
ncbi:MAG: amidase [Alphaproteobacteria bacterium]|nr:amidase [Alphaproteobacteria bacterium]